MCGILVDYGRGSYIDWHSTLLIRRPKPVYAYISK